MSAFYADLVAEIVSGSDFGADCRITTGGVTRKVRGVEEMEVVGLDDEDRTSRVKADLAYRVPSKGLPKPKRFDRFSVDGVDYEVVDVLPLQGVFVVNLTLFTGGSDARA